MVTSFRLNSLSFRLSRRTFRLQVAEMKTTADGLQRPGAEAKAYCDASGKSSGLPLKRAASANNNTLLMQ